MPNAEVAGMAQERSYRACLVVVIDAEGRSRAVLVGEADSTSATLGLQKGVILFRRHPIGLEAVSAAGHLMDFGMRQSPLLLPLPLLLQVVGGVILGSLALPISDLFGTPPLPCIENLAGIPVALWVFVGVSLKCGDRDGDFLSSSGTSTSRGSPKVLASRGREAGGFWGLLGARSWLSLPKPHG